MRIKIALGAAKSLEFLHEADKPIIYRDFKASNILLDSVSPPFASYTKLAESSFRCWPAYETILQDFTSKLSDFGLAKDGPKGDDTHVSTRVMGTQGYAALEYTS